jgi:hypothetical protein
MKYAKHIKRETENNLNREWKRTTVIKRAKKTYDRAKERKVGIYTDIEKKKSRTQREKKRIKQ